MDLEEKLQQAGKALQAIQQSLQNSISDLQHKVGHAIENQWQQHLQRESRNRQLKQFASTSQGQLGGRVVGGQNPAISPLALLPEEVRGRIDNVQLYTVARNKDEYVMVEQSDQKVVLLFTSKTGAQALHHTVGKASGGRNDSKVVEVALEQVYEYVRRHRTQTVQQDAQKDQLTFRLVPDQQEVANAVQLFRDAGVPAKSFTGVPLFQAEGLSLMTDKKPLVPIFLSKADLDVALGEAQRQQVSLQSKQLEDNASKATQAAQKAQVEYEQAVQDEHSSQEREKLAGKVAMWVEKAEKEQAKLDSVRKQRQAKVEVGCLEEVLSLMEHDTRGDWLNIILIPPAQLAQATDSKQDGKS